MTRWSREDRAGERDALPLPAGQCHALLADPRVETPGKLVHELRLRDEQRVVDLLVGGIGVPEGDVLTHARGEQRRLLETHGDLPAE